MLNLAYYFTSQRNSFNYQHDFRIIAEIVYTILLIQLDYVCIANSVGSFRPNDFPFQNWPISVSHFNKFRLTANVYRFHCLLAIFHNKIMLVLYDMGLSSILLSVELHVTFDSRH